MHNDHENVDSSILVNILNILESKSNYNGNYRHIAKTERIWGHSNKVLHVQLNDGRRMIVKQSHFDWAAPRFFGAQTVASLLRAHSNIIAPKHIRIPQEMVQKPTLAYWYLPYPTLKDLWPDLSSGQKRSAIKSFGRLLRKMHTISPERYGLLYGEDASGSLSSFLKNDLLNRLKPTMYAEWPDAVPAIDHLASLISRVTGGDKQSELVHNDLHLDNILCRTDSGKVECVGFLDLEDAKGGSWISDIANACILHHPIFADENQQVEWLSGFTELLILGYQREPDPLHLRFFQIYHLLNLGLFSVLSGENYHADLVFAEIEELRSLIFEESYSKASGSF